MLTPRCSSHTIAPLLIASAFFGVTGCSSNDASRETSDASPVLHDAGSDAAPTPNEDGGQDAEPTKVDAAPLDAAPPITGDASISGPIAAQLNDVSILFPMPKSKSDISNLLSASSSGAGGVLLPSALYDKVGHIAGSTGSGQAGSQGEAVVGDLHVVAMRLDPCFASLAPDPHGVGCTAQLRLVFQEVTTNSSVVAAYDSGLHAFYQLTREDFLSLAAAIVDLRIANANGKRLGALAPHPILVEQGLSGTMATALRALVLHYAGAKNLTRVTEFSSVDSFSWNFQGFDVSDATAADFTPMVIPVLPPPTTQEMLTPLNELADAGVPIRPAPISGDTFPDLLNTSSANRLPTTLRQSELDALTRVDNPTKNSPNTIDCVTCHVATNTSQGLASEISFKESADPYAFKADGVYVLDSEMTSTQIGTQSGVPNFHAFSYDATEPGINQRVVNESAAIVEYLNSLP